MATKSSASRSKGVTINPVIIDQAISRIQERGVNFLAIDFDRTIINEHTYGRWAGTTEELITKVRPMFAQLIPAALATNKIHIAVCTFSPQTKVIRAVLTSIVGKENSRRIPIRGHDGSWLFCGEGSPEGKQPHIASAIQELEAKGAPENSITKGSTLLIDDDARNIQHGLDDGIRAVWLDPKNPDDVLQKLRGLD